MNHNNTVNFDCLWCQFHFARGFEMSISVFEWHYDII